MRMSSWKPTPTCFSGAGAKSTAPCARRSISRRLRPTGRSSSCATHATWRCRPITPSAFPTPPPLNPTHRAEFEDKRARILEQGIDAHALEAGRDWLLPIYLRYAEFHASAPARLFLSYDDFIADPARFARRVAAFLEIDLPEAAAERLGQEADPVQSGPPKSGHKRSGRSGQWREELRPETQAELTRILAPAIERWGFV
jgi:hypothetical protein